MFRHMLTPILALALALALPQQDTSISAFGLGLPKRSADELQQMSAKSAEPVRQGFIALELHRRTQSMEHATLAARSFAAALRENNGDAWAHLGLGLTLIRERKTMAIVRAMGVADGQAASVAQREIEKALALDPELKAADSLYAVYVSRPIAPAPVDSAALALLKKPENALDYLWRARALFAAGDNKGAEQSFRDGLAQLDSEAAEAYLYDAYPVADAQEMIALTDGTLSKRAAAFDRFWQKRAVRSGVSVSERLGEHYRRMAYARKHHPMRKGVRSIGYNIFGKRRSGFEKEVDDQGLIYVRFGPPTEALRTPVPRSDTEPIAVWAYRLPDGRHQVYYFLGGRIEADLLRILRNGFSDETDGLTLLDDLARFDAHYAFMSARLQSIATYQKMLISAEEKQRFINDRLEDIQQQNERLTYMNRVRAFQAFELDRADPTFRRPLTLFHDFATFRGSGCTDIVYSLAAPASAYDLSLAVADTFSWDVQKIEARAMKETPTGGYLRATGVMCGIPDHNAYVRLTVNTDSLTGTSLGAELTVPDYSGKSLMMSDLLFAAPQPGGFTRGNVHLALIPPRQFRETQPFRVFYELYNLPKGRTYKTEITFTTVESNPFAKLFKGKRTTTVTFEGEAATDDVVQEIRTLVPEIEPGEVTVTVKVTDLTSNETATKSKTIWILPSDR